MERCHGHPLATDRDRDNPRALQLRSFVQGLHAKQVNLLREAVDLAERAWFDEAEARLDEARSVSTDDATVLDETAHAIADLHTAFGGGIRVGMGENFIAGLDVGHSSESTAALYINTGYAF